MCALVFVAVCVVVVLVSVIVFVKSAVLMLPWLAPAAVLGVLGGIGLGRDLRRKARPAIAALAGVLVAAIATAGIALAACEAIPPRAPNKKERRPGDLLVLLDMPSPTQKDIKSHKPLLITITTAASSVLTLVWLAKPSKEEGEMLDAMIDHSHGDGI